MSAAKRDRTPMVGLDAGARRVWADLHGDEFADQVEPRDRGSVRLVVACRDRSPEMLISPVGSKCSVVAGFGMTRDKTLLVYRNPVCIEQGINPFDHGSAIHTDMWKTEGLKQALELHQFDLAFGGERRDEEKSRAKERVFSIRSALHRWDPKQQRPELWRLYNARKTPGESVRVFPLSNWTELDVWQYIHREQIPIVPLYYSALRPVIERTER